MGTDESSLYRSADVNVFANLVVDFFKTEITRADEKITVIPKNFKTLEFLAKNAQRVISQEEHLDRVLGGRALLLDADGG
jgi:DNA-binding winged helix-turn-helix (wHTH) protein